MRKFLRSYWQPIAAEEMPVGGAPLPIRIMSEDLVLFRDDKDQLGLIGQFCPSRPICLWAGRGRRRRCLYHGWLFDIHGKCLDQPAGAPGKSSPKVRHTAYPVQGKGGAIWAYLGEADRRRFPTSSS